jgi:hypothetical protein
MGGIAVLLTALTVLDYMSGSGSPGSRSQRAMPAAPAVGESARPSTPTGQRTEHASASAVWREIRTLTQLQDNAAAVTKRYQALAVPYAEMMAEVAVVQDADEKPEAAAKRGLGALLPAEVQIKALLVADDAVKQQDNTLLTVSLSLESSDSRAMQQAVLALGNPAAGLVWRELSVSADSEKRLIQTSGVLSVLSIRMAE